MGYAADTNDAGESLFVAHIDFDGGSRSSKGLGAIDTRAFRLGVIGPFNPIIPGAELTGTGDGRLFAFYTGPQPTGSHIAEIDKTSGRILSQDTLRVGTTQDAFAFAYWGGEFWIFTSAAGPSTVTRYDLATKTETTVASAPNTIVGAGVSTCAPSQ